jgi:hypothetical protein
MVKMSGKPEPDGMQDLMDQIDRKLTDGDFSSLEEAQMEIDALTHQKNATPLAAFHGLSPEQMHRILHFPFDSPNIVRFTEDPARISTAPVLTLFSLLVEAIGEPGMKATEKGNLPRSFCREAALSYWGEEKYTSRNQYGSIRSEKDFFDMHCLKLVAGLAGLVRKYKGTFVLTATCRKKIASQGIEAVYPDLFKAYVNKFNWAYRYGYQEIRFIQQSFLFTIFLLSKYGETLRPQSFYEDHYLTAFPALPMEIEQVPYQTPEEAIRRTLFYTTFMHFAEFFGLAELQAKGKEGLARSYEIRKLPLLDQFISFTC